MGALYLIDGMGKQYIGITMKTAEARFVKHRHAANAGVDSYLHRAMRLHGIDNFSVKTLVIADSRDYLIDLEMRAVEAFKTKVPDGYNMTAGGDGFHELAAEIREANRHKFVAAWADPDRRARRIEAMRAPEFRARHSEIMRKALASDEARRAVGDRSRLANNRPETKELIRRNSTAMHSDPDFKAKHRAAMQECMGDPARRAAIAELVWAKRRERAANQSKEAA